VARCGATRLHEQFLLGITDPTDAAFAGEDGAFNPALAPFDLTSGGSPLAYDQSFTIKQQAGYAQGRYQGRQCDVEPRPPCRPLRTA
jgi:hypothetical protein